jgi:hypothetical protein
MSSPAHNPYLRSFSAFSNSRDSSVSIVTGYGLDDQGSEFMSRYGEEIPHSLVAQTGSGAHPMGAGLLFPRGQIDRRAKMNTHIHILERLRKRGYRHPFPHSKWKSKSYYDRQSVGQSILESGPHPGTATNFSFSFKFSLDSCGLVIL